MTEILDKVKLKIAQLSQRIETHDDENRVLLFEERLGVYEELLPDISSLLNTIESQQTQIADGILIETIYREERDEARSDLDVAKAKIESQKEEIKKYKWEDEQFSWLQEQIKTGSSENTSLKAITELAVKSLNQYADLTNWVHEDVWDGGGNPCTLAQSTLSEIERLSQ